MADSTTTDLRDFCRLPSAAMANPIRELCGDAGIAIRTLANGVIHSIASPDVPITLYRGDALEGGPTNLYLRVLRGGAVEEWAPLLGGETNVGVAADDDGMTVEGMFAGIAYVVHLRMSQQPGWSWTMRLRNETDAEVACDVVYVQDVGMSNAGNEAYISQYVDHTVLEHPHLGYVLCARQNMPQRGGHPWLMVACRQGCRGFATDGFDFYGCEHRTTRRPAALDQAKLPNDRRQYEFSACVLQSETICLEVDGDEAIDFFAVFQADHPEPTSDEDLALVPTPEEPVLRNQPGRPAAYGDAAPPHQACSAPGGAGSPQPALSSSLFATAPLLDADHLSAAQLAEYWSRQRRHVETDDSGCLLSFFTEDDTHVVLKAKELVQERPTGAVLRSGTGLVNERGIVSMTAYMRGVFVSHLALGNLSFNVALSVRRDPLGVLLAGGLRVFVERNDAFELLGVPSAFENSLTGCRWLYISGDDVIEVRAWVGTETHMAWCEVRSRVPRRLRVAMGIVMGAPDSEPVLTDVADVGEEAITLRPAEGSRFRDRNPDAAIHIVPADSDTLTRIGSDELLFVDCASRGAPCLVLNTRETTRFRVAFTGSLDGAGNAVSTTTVFAEYAPFEEEAARSRRAYASLTSGFSVSADDRRVARIGTVLPWFVQNAVIHLSAPHGLEQYLGAAWGTRDVCQGPLEMLLALGREIEARDILTTVFANQHMDGGWPQWFMYDNNSDIRAGDAHGDVVFWPVKALCDYIKATDDLSLLDEALPYHRGGDEVESVFEHVLRALGNIREAFVSGTSLVAYGHGDWNDSLQPADSALARQMVSSWTVELCYQVIDGLARACTAAGRAGSAAELTGLAAEVRGDFNARLVHDGLVCGFGILDDNLSATPLLHPSDTRTRIHYRLLPMIRGIISGIFTLEQARRHADVIAENLLCPDGARLMDRPPRYDGGRQHIFQRGESSTFFGREIGIMYVHAHIRYAEAMARLGRADKLLDAIMSVVPVEIEESVPNAVLRQRNAYFSSSDAAFDNRAQADSEYGRVKDGTVPVKGGWRVYSSGPGLFVSLVIRHMLGLRRCGDRMVFDPVLPKSLDGLCVDWPLCDKRVRIRYVVKGDSSGPTGLSVKGEAIAAEREEHPYRTGGLSVSLADLAGRLAGDGNEVIVAM